MLTYGSYLDEDTDVLRSSILITIADVGVAILAELVIFPIVFTFGLEPTLGTELAFSTLPQAFDAVPFGRWIALAFFGLLFFAALSSAISLMEVGVASLIRTTGQSRGRIAGWLTGFVLLLGLPSALSYSAARWQLFGVPVLDWMDEAVGTLALPVTAFCIAIVFTWFQDRETLRHQLGSLALVPLLKYVIPAVLLGVTIVRSALGLASPGGMNVPTPQSSGPSRGLPSSSGGCSSST